MTKERITAQLEILAAKGVKAVCPIQRSPGRCDPQSFDPEWWQLFAHTHEAFQRLGMQLWAYDQAGPWTDYALPTYSGIDVYTQNLHLTDRELKRRAKDESDRQ